MGLIIGVGQARAAWHIHAYWIVAISRAHAARRRGTHPAAGSGTIFTAADPFTIVVRAATRVAAADRAPVACSVPGTRASAVALRGAGLDVAPRITTKVGAILVGAIAATAAAGVASDAFTVHGAAAAALG